MKPILKGWVWNIPFYPISDYGARTVKSVFWYDSSKDLEFTKFSDEYQILVPENLIIGSDSDKKLVRDKVDYIWKNKIQMIFNNEGSWTLVIPDSLVTYSFLSI